MNKLSYPQKNFSFEENQQLGLKRGTVSLVFHDNYWECNAKETISLLWSVLDKIALDIQHIGSTSIKNIHAKPIIDIVVGVKQLNDLLPYIPLLKEKNIFFRGEERTEQLLFVKGDFTKDTRTHHIHIAIWNSNIWNNYIAFRDYLNEFPEKAIKYDVVKMNLAQLYSNDRNTYTNKKNEIISQLLIKAKEWKNQK